MREAVVIPAVVAVLVGSLVVARGPKSKSAFQLKYKQMHNNLQYVIDYPENRYIRHLLDSMHSIRLCILRVEITKRYDTCLGAIHVDYLRIRKYIQMISIHKYDWVTILYKSILDPYFEDFIETFENNINTAQEKYRNTLLQRVKEKLVDWEKILGYALHQQKHYRISGVIDKKEKKKFCKTWNH